MKNIKFYLISLSLTSYSIYNQPSYSQEESSVEFDQGSDTTNTSQAVNEKKESSSKSKEAKKITPTPKDKSKSVTEKENSKENNSVHNDLPLTVIDFTYEHPEKGFKMQVPSDWDVKTDYNGYELFMEPKTKMVPTQDNPVAADPNISVKVLSKKIYLDQIGLDDYEKEITQKFIEANGAGSGFQIFQKTLFDLTPTTKALLYDVTFKNNTYDIFQTIVVMASEERMYRLTLTDYKVFFDKNREKYFPILASVQIEGNPPVRENPFQKFIPWIGGLLGVVGAIVGLGVYRRRRATNHISHNDSDSSNYDSLTQHPHSHAGSLTPTSSSGPSHSEYDVSSSSSHVSRFDGESQESVPLSQAVGQPTVSKKDNKKEEPPKSSGFGVSKFDD